MSRPPTCTSRPELITSPPLTAIRNDPELLRHDPELLRHDPGLLRPRVFVSPKSFTCTWTSYSCRKRFSRRSTSSLCSSQSTSRDWLSSFPRSLTCPMIIRCQRKTSSSAQNHCSDDVWNLSNKNIGYIQQQNDNICYKLLERRSNQCQERRIIPMERR